MKIIDLLNKIANGEDVPKKIKYQDEEYILNKICLDDNKTHIDYYLKGRELLLFEDIINIVLNFNDEVEILEEEKKIPEKLEYIITDENGNFSINGFTFDYEQKMQIIDTLNEIIDYLKNKGE